MKAYCYLENKKRFLQSYEINTHDELWNFINQVKKNTYLVFRGVNEAKYMLYSSAQVRTGASMKQEEYAKIIEEAIKEVKASSVIVDYLKQYSADKTDFQILALMQHYGCGTPIIDYSTDIDSALFFATDRRNGVVQTAELDDKSIDAYISIYYFDTRDPDHCSIQKVNEKGQFDVKLLDAQLAKQYGRQYTGISQQTIDSLLYMPFSELVQMEYGGLFSVWGHSNGVIMFNLAGKSVEYNINNERIEAQSGLFIFNGGSKTPYEEAAFNWYSGIKNYCVNIHKSLEGEIKRYLLGKGINHDIIYPNSEESQDIVKELRKLNIDKRLKPLA